jgi:hypothetical protein
MPISARGGAPLDIASPKRRRSPIALLSHELAEVRCVFEFRLEMADVDQVDHRKKQPRPYQPDELSLISTSNRPDEIESDAIFQAKNSPADQPWRTSKGNLRSLIGPLASSEVASHTLELAAVPDPWYS